MGPGQSEGFSLRKGAGLHLSWYRRKVRCGHRYGWDGPVKLVLGRGGGCSGYLSFLGSVCESRAVGDTRGEEQGTHLSGEGTAPQRGGLVVQAAVRFGTWRQKWGVSAVSTIA